MNRTKCSCVKYQSDKDSVSALKSSNSVKFQFSHVLCRSRSFFRRSRSFFCRSRKTRSLPSFTKNCVTDEQKQAYVDDILENQGIQLDPAKIVFNPGVTGGNFVSAGQ